MQVAAGRGGEASHTSCVQRRFSHCRGRAREGGKGGVFRTIAGMGRKRCRSCHTPRLTLKTWKNEEIADAARQREALQRAGRTRQAAWGQMRHTAWGQAYQAVP